MRSRVLPWGTPSTMSTTTTSASSFAAIPCATVAPTFPPPTTVTFVFIAKPRVVCNLRAHSIRKGNGMLSDFSRVANEIGATTKKSVKERILADYLVTLDDASLERAVVFFSGSPFPRREQRVTGVGWSTIADAVAMATGKSLEELWEIYPKYADLGVAVAELYGDASGTVPLSEAGEMFDLLSATGRAAEKTRVRAALLGKIDGQGARYIIKILQNEIRIGLQEGLVESAIAKAFGRGLEAVRRANMFTGDIG